jgi:hypothetical protein
MTIPVIAQAVAILWGAVTLGLLARTRAAEPTLRPVTVRTGRQSG